MRDLRIILTKLFDAGWVAEEVADDVQQFKQDAMNEAEKAILANLQDY